MSLLPLALLATRFPAFVGPLQVTSPVEAFWLVLAAQLARRTEQQRRRSEARTLSDLHHAALGVALGGAGEASARTLRAPAGAEVPRSVRPGTPIQDAPVALHTWLGTARPSGALRPAQGTPRPRNQRVFALASDREYPLGRAALEPGADGSVRVLDRCPRRRVTTRRVTSSTRPGSRPPPRPHDPVAAALSYERTGDWTAALTAWRGAARALDEARVLGLLGRHGEAAEIYGRVGEPSQAAEALAADGQHASAASIFVRLRRPRRALVCLEAAGDWVNAARICRSLRLLEEGRSYARRVRARDPRYWEAVAVLAELELGLGNLVDAGLLHRQLVARASADGHQGMAVASWLAALVEIEAALGSWSEVAGRLRELRALGKLGARYERRLAPILAVVES